MYPRYENRRGKISFRYKRRWHYITSRPQFFIRRRWRRVRRYRGKISVRVRQTYRPVKLRRGIPVYRAQKSAWRRISNRRKGGRRRRQRRRKYRRYRRRTRRMRRYRRRERRRVRRIRRLRRRNSPFKIYYRGMTRKIFKWKGKLTFRFLGRRRRIR